MNVYFTRTWEISARGNPNKMLESLIGRLEISLRKFDFESKRNQSLIEYRKVLRRTNNYGINMREAMKFTRRGKISLITQTNNTIKIKSFTSLNHLIFATTGLGLLLMLLSWLYGSNLNHAGIISLMIMISLFLLGWAGISSRVGEIIDNATKKT
jgi:hypothetical protein